MINVSIIKLDEISKTSVDTPPKTNMTMEKQAFEDVSPIKHGDYPVPC